MLAALLPLLFYLSPATPEKLTIATDTIVLRGSCWDVLSGKNVIARISALENRQNRFLAQSTATGEFSIPITDATQQLTFEVKGYPTTVVPINKSSRVDTNARFLKHVHDALSAHLGALGANSSTV